MTDEKKIQVSTVSLVIAIVFELIKFLTELPERAFNILWGLQLILVFVALGISAKMMGNFGASRKLKIQSKVILLLAAVLGVYVFII